MVTYWTGPHHWWVTFDIVSSPHIWLSQNETHSLGMTVYSVTECTRIRIWWTASVLLAGLWKQQNMMRKDCWGKEIMFVNVIGNCKAAVRLWDTREDGGEGRRDGGSLDKGSLPSITQLEPGNFPFHQSTNPHVSVVHPWLDQKHLDFDNSRSCGGL